MPRRSTSGNAAESTGVYVALLRGVNLGGNNKLPMTDFAEAVRRAGGFEVRTYIQSGNAVFAADRSAAESLPERIRDRLAKDCGVNVPVIIRDLEAMAAVADANPFLRAGQPPETLHVGFLADLPDPRRVAALDPKRSPGDSFEVRGREVYLHLPNGVAPSKLTSAYFDTTLGATITIRNWRTVLKLVEMMRACAEQAGAPAPSRRASR